MRLLGVILIFTAGFFLPLDLLLAGVLTRPTGPVNVSWPFMGDFFLLFMGLIYVFKQGQN